MGKFGSVKPLLGTPLDRGHPLSRGLVGCWLVNDNPPVLGILHDVSENGNHGTLVADTHIVPGKFGSCLSFDGTGDYIQLSSLRNCTGQEWTFSLWVNFSNILTDLIILSSEATGGADEIIQLFMSSATGSIRCYNDFNLATVGPVVTTGIWYHVAFSFSYSRQKAILFVDGKIVATDTSFTNPGSIIGLFRIGSYAHSSASKCHNGQIDDVMIYNRALSASEVQQLYIDPFQMFYRPRIEIFSAVTPAGGVGIMTTNTGYWGATY